MWMRCQGMVVIQERSEEPRSSQQHWLAPKAHVTDSPGSRALSCRLSRLLVANRLGMGKIRASNKSYDRRQQYKLEKKGVSTTTGLGFKFCKSATSVLDVWAHYCTLLSLHLFVKVTRIGVVECRPRRAQPGSYALLAGGLDISSYSIPVRRGQSICTRPCCFCQRTRHAIPCFLVHFSASAWQGPENKQEKRIRTQHEERAFKICYQGPLYMTKYAAVHHIMLVPLHSLGNYN